MGRDMFQKSSLLRTSSSLALNVSHLAKTGAKVSLAKSQS